MEPEHESGGREDAAPEAAFDVAPELFGPTATASGRRRVTDDTAR